MTIKETKPNALLEKIRDELFLLRCLIHEKIEDSEDKKGGLVEAIVEQLQRTNDIVNDRQFKPLSDEVEGYILQHATNGWMDLTRHTGIMPEEKRWQNVLKMQADRWQAQMDKRDEKEELSFEVNPETGNYHESALLQAWRKFAAIRTAVHEIGARYPEKNKKVGSRYAQVHSMDVGNFPELITDILINVREMVEDVDGDDSVDLGEFVVDPETYRTGSGSGIFEHCTTVSDALKVARESIAGAVQGRTG